MRKVVLMDLSMKTAYKLVKGFKNTDVTVISRRKFFNIYYYKRIKKSGGKVFSNTKITQIYKNTNADIASVECLFRKNTVRIDGEVFISAIPIYELISAMEYVPQSIVRAAGVYSKNPQIEVVRYINSINNLYCINMIF